MKKFGLFICLFTCAGAAPGQQPGTAAHSRHKPVVKKHPPANIRYGTASFYANKFEGRRMANGALFHQKNFTAASNTIPLGKWVRVTCIRNKRSVAVRITDRMNASNHRLIDLSHSAAASLKYTGNGLARVKVEILSKRPADAVVIDK